MCVYGIGLPYDHPIWKSLPPCKCGDDEWSHKSPFEPVLPRQPGLPPAWGPFVPVTPVPITGPHKCPDCGVWWAGFEHRCQLGSVTGTTTTTTTTTTATADFDVTDHSGEQLPLFRDDEIETHSFSSTSLSKLRCDKCERPVWHEIHSTWRQAR
jgi:hypothetical protein